MSSRSAIKPVISLAEKLTFDTLDRGDLLTIGLILDEPGWGLVKSCILGEYARMNSLGGVTGDPFKDGKLVGRAEGLNVLQTKIEAMEAEVRKEAARNEE
jgi:hypothetical protein